MKTRRLASISSSLTAACALLLSGAVAHAQAPKPDAAKPDAAKPDAAKPDAAKPDAAQPDAAQPTPEDIEKAKQAFIKGRELFEKADYEGAVKEFKEAYRLSKNPLLLYNIGFTLDQMKQKELALFYYEKFMTDAGPNAGQYAEVAARVKELKGVIESESVFDSGSMKAVNPKAGDKPDGGQPDAGAQTTKITGFMHKVVEETPPGLPLDITAFIPEGVEWQVTLFFRSAQESKFTSTVMKPRYNELVGRIPAEKTTSGSVQYYIEVRNKNGQIESRSGRSTSPHLVLVDERAKPRYYPDLTDERNYAGANTGALTGPTGPDTGAEQTPGGGFFNDTKARPYQIAKWGATATAAGFLIGSVAFYVSASQYSTGLEEEARFSTTDDVCSSGNPCRTWDETRRDIDSTGKRFETLSYVTMGVGLVAAGAAGYLWYRELMGKRGSSGATATAAGSGSPSASAATGVRETFTAVPVIGDGFVGGAAAFRF